MLHCAATWASAPDGTFVGYLAAGLDSGLDLEVAMRRAAVAASLACLKVGAQPAIPTRQELEAALP